MKVTREADSKASPCGGKDIKDLPGTEIHSREDLIGQHGDFIHKKSGDVVPNSS